MRVRISYGVHIEDVPTEIEQLFDFVYEKKLKLDNQLELVEKLLEEREHEASIEAMKRLRKTLEEMDARISDVSSICEGLVAYKEQDTQGDGHEVSTRGPFMDSASDNVVQGTEQPTGN